MPFLLDNNLILVESDVLAADSTSAALDVGVNVGAVDLVSVIAQVLTDTTSAGTLTINVQDSTDGSTSWSTIATSGAITMTTLDVDDEIVIAMPRANKRYIRVVHDVSADLGTSAIKTLITPAVTAA